MSRCSECWVDKGAWGLVVKAVTSDERRLYYQVNRCILCLRQAENIVALWECPFTAHEYWQISESYFAGLGTSVNQPPKEGSTATLLLSSREVPETVWEDYLAFMQERCVWESLQK